MKILKNLLLFFGILVLAYFFSTSFGDLYQRLFNDPGTWVDVRGIAGLPFAYIFFLFLLFTTFGKKGKYWWAGILVLPAIAFEVYFDLVHLYFPIALGIIGWMIGIGIAKIIHYYKK